jgi:hypothetical protein
MSSSSGSGSGEYVPNKLRGVMGRNNNNNTGGGGLVPTSLVSNVDRSSLVERPLTDNIEICLMAFKLPLMRTGRRRVMMTTLV